jgi:hypothetical protein
MKESERIAAQIEQVRLSGRQAQAELNRALIDALGDQRALQRAPELREQLAALPVQIRELTRRRVLAELQELAAEIAELKPEFERLNQVDDEARAAVNEHRRQQNKQTPDTRTQYAQTGQALDARYKLDLRAFELLTQKIRALYGKAAFGYGVAIDGSDLERWATGRAHLAPLPTGPAAWEAAAAKAGQEAERRFAL